MTVTDNAPVRNGVDTAALFATLDAVKGQPDIAKFNSGRPTDGSAAPTTAARSMGSTAPGRSTSCAGLHLRRRPPAGVGGRRHGPTPAEYVLHALAACLTAGSPTSPRHAGSSSPRCSRPWKATSTCSGILGLDDTVRNGYERIRVSFMVKGNAPAEKLRELVEQSRRRSAVFDVITNPVPVTIDVTTA